MIRSLIGWVRCIGYSGLVILFDEGEQESGIRGKNKKLLLSNLRDLIDECTQPTFANSMFFYSVPDEDFFQGGEGVYLALNQRLSTTFSEWSPLGVKISLVDTINEPEAILCEIGEKLGSVFETAYGIKLDAKVLDKSITNTAHAAWEARHWEIGYKRLFVQAIVAVLQHLRKDTATTITPETAKAIVASMV